MAGGIGITLHGHDGQMTREDRSFECTTRCATNMGPIEGTVGRYGAHRVKIYCDEEKLFIPVDDILNAQPLGTHLYVCGPDRSMGF
jgi:hypothetical protein